MYLQIVQKSNYMDLLFTKYYKLLIERSLLDTNISKKYLNNYLEKMTVAQDFKP
jgi:hypothetical protein